MTKSRISHHDRYIRSMMAHPKVAEEFFENHLPENIKDVVDLSSISMQIADILFSAKFQGEQGYFYLLVEHASSPDKMLPFRMLKYMIAIMDSHLIKAASRKLPVIYPLILYTGKKPFRHSMDLFDLFGQDKALAKDILKKPYQLIDLTQVSDEALKQYQWFGTAALMAKYIHSQDIHSVLKENMGILKVLESS